LIVNDLFFLSISYWKFSRFL